MNYQEIRKEKEVRVSKLIKDCRMFFAFSDEQFEEGKTVKEPDEKYLALGAGCYMPKSCLPIWKAGNDAIDAWQKEVVKNNKLEDKEILYELENHEAFYTGDIEDTFEALEKKYTREHIWKVYNKNSKNHDY